MKTKLCTFLGLLLFWLIATNDLVAQPEFRKVSAYDLIGCYLPVDQWIETSGHIWISDGLAFMAASVPSAMVPVELDISNVASETVQTLRSRCAAANQFSGGCAAIVRGQTVKNRQRPGLRVVDIRFGDEKP